MPAEIRTSVLVVGGALSGLSSALFLRSLGIECLLVERHRDLLVFPRLSGITTRTVEVYSQFGLADQIAEASEITRVEVINAETIADRDWLQLGAGEKRTSIPQHRLEAILRAEAQRRGAELRFATELRSFTEDTTGITAALRDHDSDTETVVRADYVIAADGADSKIRNTLGVESEGVGIIDRRFTVFFEADLEPALQGRHFDIAHLRRPRPGTVLLPADSSGRHWRFQTSYKKEESLKNYSSERLRCLIREAVGIPDLRIRRFLPLVPGSDVRVLEFVFGACVAEEYRLGRVFFVGDSAHLMPPAGGFGGSAGVQDAHNLAWKLAAVLHGQAGTDLLDTYHAERRPVGVTSMQQALARLAERNLLPANTQISSIEPHLAVGSGYQYRSSAVLGAPDAAASRLLPPDEQRGQPGTRAPFVTVCLDGQEISTLDLYGSGFVILAGCAGGSWLQVAHSLAADLGIPIAGYRFGHELQSVGRDAHEAHGIGAHGALVVRPDGFVAWQVKTGIASPADELRRVMTSVLHRPVARVEPA